MAAVEADDHGRGLDGLDPARQVGHEDAPGHEVVRVCIMGEEISILAAADAMDRPVPGEIDEDDLRLLRLLRQPLG
jgi:hypothetical protein